MSGFKALLAQAVARFPSVNDSDATLHLFHAPNSICSQKVRAVLAERGIAYQSHLLNIFAGDTYAADYVRLRMAGCDAADLPMVTQHLGTTSVVSSGCDGCVVPTVADAQTESVLVDSHGISLAMNTYAGAVNLIPDDLAELIAFELSVVDELPNYQGLAVRVVPASAPTNAFAASKVARCDALLTQHGDDPALRRAYEAKRTKEQNAAETLFSDAALAVARKAVTDALEALETRLAAQPGGHLYGERFTMADLFWGCELLRIEELGNDTYWKDGRLPRVAAYHQKLSQRPSLRAAIIDFPSARMAGKH